MIWLYWFWRFQSLLSKSQLKHVDPVTSGATSGGHTDPAPFPAEGDGVQEAVAMKEAREGGGGRVAGEPKAMSFVKHPHRLLTPENSLVATPPTFPHQQSLQVFRHLSLHCYPPMTDC